MASLVKRKSGNYSLMWTDRSKSSAQVKESLKTDNQRESKKIKEALEFAYRINKHNPWQTKWYENNWLREIILTGNYERLFNINKQPLSVSLFEASERYIDFKTNTPGEWDSERTQYNYSYRIRNFVEFTGPDLTVDDITQDHLTGYVKRKELSDFSIQTELRRIKSFLNWCEEQDYLNEVPAVSGPNPQKKIPDFLYNDELKSVCLYKIDKELQQVKSNPQFHENMCQWWIPLFWILLARTGMRPSELIRVRLAHITGYEINVRADSKGKSQSAKRRVPLMAQEARQCIDVLTDPGIRTKDQKMSDNNLLFGRGSDTSKRRASREFTEAVKKCVPEKNGFTLKDLRNNFAYWFLTLPSDEANMFRAYKLKRLLGHSTSKMSEYYLDTLPFNPDLERLHKW